MESVLELHIHSVLSELTNAGLQSMHSVLSELNRVFPVHWQAPSCILNSELGMVQIHIEFLDWRPSGHGVHVPSFRYSVLLHSCSTIWKSNICGARMW